MGIKNVYISCDLNNSASKKVIEANGGKSIGKVRTGESSQVKLRFFVQNA